MIRGANFTRKSSQGWQMYFLAPAAGGAGLVAGDAAALGLGELVDVDEAVARPGDDLAPLDGLDVAQVVVVHDPHAPLEDV